MALDRRRSDRRRSVREIEHGSRVDASPSHAMADAERAEMLWEAIDSLPEKLRRVVVLASIEGHDIAAIAGLLGIPPGTVKSRLFLARQQLKERLQWLNTTATNP